MLNKLADALFNPSIENLQSKLTETTAERDLIRLEYQGACLAAEEGDTDAAKQRQALARKLDAVNTRIDELNAAIDASRVRAAHAAEDAERAERSARWDEAAGRAQHRVVLAAKFEKQLAAAFATFEELVSESLAFHQAAPRRDDELAHSIVSRSRMESALRVHLMRAHQQRWAWSWIGDPRNAPTLSDSVAKGNSLILSFRDDGAQ